MLDVFYHFLKPLKFHLVVDDDVSDIDVISFLYLRLNAPCVFQDIVVGLLDKVV